MPRQRGTSDTYTGHSGQMAVMAKLLFRRCNVAIPEVDTGTDVFAFLDESEFVARIQVKTARGKPYKNESGYSAQFNIPTRQLAEPNEPPLFYALAARLEDRWADFLIFSRPDLYRYGNGPLRFGTDNPKTSEMVLTIQFRPSGVVCGEVDLTPHRGAWHRLPPIRALARSDQGPTFPS